MVKLSATIEAGTHQYNSMPVFGGDARNFQRDMELGRAVVPGEEPAKVLPPLGARVAVEGARHDVAQVAEVQPASGW